MQTNEYMSEIYSSNLLLFKLRDLHCILILCTINFSLSRIYTGDWSVGSYLGKLTLLVRACTDMTKLLSPIN